MKYKPHRIYWPPVQRGLCSFLHTRFARWRFWKERKEKQNNVCVQARTRTKERRGWQGALKEISFPHPCTELLLVMIETHFRPQLFKRWIALSTEEITIQWITQLVFVLLISLIAIYPVDSATQLLNNQEWQEFKQKLSELVMSNRRNPLGKSKLMTSRPSTFSVHKFQSEHFFYFKHFFLVVGSHF